MKGIDSNLRSVARRRFIFFLLKSSLALNWLPICSHTIQAYVWVPNQQELMSRFQICFFFLDPLLYDVFKYCVSEHSIDMKFPPDHQPSKCNKTQWQHIFLSHNVKKRHGGRSKISTRLGQGTSRNTQVASFFFGPSLIKSYKLDFCLFLKFGSGLLKKVESETVS